MLEHFQGFNILKCEIAADIRTEGCLMDIQILVSGWKDLVVSWDITQCRNCTFQNDEQLKLFNTLKIIINIYICSTTSVKHFKPAEHLKHFTWTQQCSNVNRFKMKIFLSYDMKRVFLNTPKEMRSAILIALYFISMNVSFLSAFFGCKFIIDWMINQKFTKILPKIKDIFFHRICFIIIWWQTRRNEEEGRKRYAYMDWFKLYHYNHDSCCLHNIHTFIHCTEFLYVLCLKVYNLSIEHYPGAFHRAHLFICVYIHQLHWCPHCLGWRKGSICWPSWTPST